MLIFFKCRILELWGILRANSPSILLMRKFSKVKLNDLLKIIISEVELELASSIQVYF